MGRVLLALVSTLVLVTQVMAGTWTSNNFLYKPAIGARGDDEKVKFDSGLNRVDSRLANEKWLNDSRYNGDLGAAITTIGSAQTVLSIPAGNWPIAANLTVPANLTLKFAHGAVLTVATGKTLTINGTLDAGPFPIFSCAGTGKVVFGPGTRDSVYAEWWGAKADFNSTTGVGTDNAPAINAAFASGIKTVQLLNGSYRIDSTIFIPSLGRLLGTSVNGTSIYPVKTGGTWTASFAIMVNSTDGTTWTTAYPPPGALIQDLGIRGLYQSTYCDVKAICHAGPVDINRVRIYQMKAGIYKTSDYGDASSYRKVNILYGSDPAGYDIDMSQLGDAMHVENCAVGGSSTAGVRFTGIGGGNIKSSVFNCPVTITSCYGGTTFQDIHTEGNYQWTITDSNIAIRDSWIAKSYSGPTLTFSSTGTNRHNSVVDNVQFVVWNTEWDNFTSDVADIDYAGTALDIRNSVRRLYQNGAIAGSQLFGISVAYNGTLLPEFNNFSYVLSHKARLGLSTNKVDNFLVAKYMPAAASVWYPIAGIGTSSIGTWQLAGTATYYYLTQAIMDPTRRLGHTAATIMSQAATQGGNCIYLSYTGGVQGITLRVYRGTAAGVYDSYVDLPLDNVGLLYDNGLSIAGYVWKSRTAGPVDGIMNYIINAEITAVNATVKVLTAAPTKGVWTVTDRAIRTPEVGQPKAWVCTVAGGATSTTRANTTAYSAGTWAVWTTGTTVWECQVAGTSSGSPPSIVGKVVGDTVVDGTVTWICRSLTTATWISDVDGTGTGAWGSITGTITDQTEFTAAPTASKVPIADGSGKLDGWITTPLYPTGSAAGLTNFPTLNQDTSGSAASLSGTPGLSKYYGTDAGGTKGFFDLPTGGGVPTTITTVDEATDASCFLSFFTAATGDLGPKTNSGLTFNSATGMLSATGFTGPLTGAASSNILTTAKGAASGVASLNGSTKVVEDPANATATATASKIPIADGSGKLDTWITTPILATAKGAASGVASLDAGTKVVENPANATATPTASKIPIADGSGKLDGWITTPYPITSGGTGQTTAQAAINALTAVSGASNEHVLTKDTATGNATFKASAGGGGAWGSITGTITDQTDLVTLLGGVNIPSPTEFEYISTLTSNAQTQLTSVSNLIASGFNPGHQHTAIATAGGTVDAITATYSPAVSLTNGTVVYLVAAGANTGAATFAPNGLTAKAIVKNIDTALSAGAISGANFIAHLIYISSLDHWVLLNSAN